MKETNEFSGMSDEIDVHVQAMLEALDPERTDPGYWHRLHRWVVNAAGPELARRRRVATATVSEVVLSWWQTLVPTAAVAAALAAFLLFRQAPRVQPAADMDMDEMVMQGVDAPVMPAFEAAGPAGGIVLVNER